MVTSASLEALLFASGEPMSKKRLAGLLNISEGELVSAIADLHTTLYERGIALIETEQELELRTSQDATEIVRKLREGELSKDLGKAGLETLAIILYRGGATRSEIDWIRGVNSSGTVRSLLLRGLIERTEDPSDKRKFRYHPTTDALAHLGVSQLSDLPRYSELSKEADGAVAQNPDHANV